MFGSCLAQQKLASREAGGNFQSKNCGRPTGGVENVVASAFQNVKRVRISVAPVGLEILQHLLRNTGDRPQGVADAGGGSRRTAGAVAMPVVVPAVAVANVLVPTAAFTCEYRSLR